MVCRDFILPEPASYVFFYAIFNLRNLLYIIIRMNPNADYLGIVTMLRRLREQGLVSGSEAKKIAARLRVQLGADIIISL